MSGSQSPPFTSALNDPFDIANADNLHQPGFLGVSPDVWKSLAGFGGNMAAAANARTPGGFLAYGGGFAGPFGAAIGASQQQGLGRAQTLSDIGYRGALTQGQLINNSLSAMQAQLQMRMMYDPQFRQQMMSSFGMGGSGPLAASGAPSTGGAATATGDTPQGGSPFYRGIAGMETGDKPNATNEASGASGPAQFLPDTWNNFAKENPQYFAGKTPEQILAMRSDPQLSATATDWLAAKNAPILKAAGFEATPQNLGIAHAFGGAGAAGILKFPDQASLAQVLQATQPNAAADILRENPQYQRMTVGDLKNKYAKLGPTSWMTAQGGQGQPQPAPYQVAQAGNGPIPVPSGAGGQQTASVAPSQSVPQQPPPASTRQQSPAPWAVPQQTAQQQPATPQQPPASSSAPPQQSAAQQQASDMMARANAAEQQANQLEQQRSAVAAENVRRENMAKMFPTMAPFITPLQMPVGDAPALRAEAQQLRQAALQIQTAAPIAYEKSQNTSFDLRAGGMHGQPNGQGGFNYTKNPQLETSQDASGNTVYAHVSPPMPGSPEGTPGTSTPVLDENGNPLIKALPKNLQEARNKSYEDFAGKDTDSFIAAQNTQGWLEQMNHAADTLNKTGGMLGTGPTAPARLAFANNVNDILRTAGLPTVYDPNAIASWEELKKATTTAGFELSSHYEGHARQAAQTIMNATSAVPSASNTPIGFHVVSAGIQEAAQQAIDVHNFKQSVYDKSGDLNQAEVQFYKSNPAQMYARRAISTVTPYDVKQDSDLSRFLPGTFVRYKGNIIQVPDRAGAPPTPDYLKHYSAPPGINAPQPGATLQ